MIICPGCCSPDWWRRVVVRREAGGERREAGGERREARGGKREARGGKREAGRTDFF